MASKTQATIRKRLKRLQLAQFHLRLEAMGKLTKFADNQIREVEKHLGVTREWLRLHIPLHAPLNPTKQQRDALIKLVTEGWDSGREQHVDTGKESA